MKKKKEKIILMHKLRQGLFHSPNRQYTEEFPLRFTPSLLTRNEDKTAEAITPLAHDMRLRHGPELRIVSAGKGQHSLSGGFHLLGLPV